MDTAEMKTYAGWLRIGRVVNKGEKALFYLLPDEGDGDDEDSRPLFTIEQTVEHDDVEATKDWTRVVPAEDRPAARNKGRKSSDGRPVVRIDYDYSTKAVRVWCGPNKEAIRMLKKGGYHYDARQHRWTATRDDIDKVVEGLSYKDRFRIVLTPKPDHPEI